VIPIVDGYPIEIQVRTLLQDLWAQTLERLADALGRGIRYGTEPRVGAEVFRQLQEMADAVALTEENLLDFEKLNLRAEELVASGNLDPAEKKQLSEIRRNIRRGLKRIPEHAATLQDLLSDILGEVQRLGLQ
jgi:ppGpp synthetase/RelA/SpoT-type nucleotidyltranferase